MGLFIVNAVALGSMFKLGDFIGYNLELLLCWFPRKKIYKYICEKKIKKFKRKYLNVRYINTSFLIIEKYCFFNQSIYFSFVFKEIWRYFFIKWCWRNRGILSLRSAIDLEFRRGQRFRAFDVFYVGIDKGIC